jgi:hypothetical protein
MLSFLGGGDGWLIVGTAIYPTRLAVADGITYGWNIHRLPNDGSILGEDMPEMK